MKAKEDANANGKIYDSRDGMALLYRYQPRPILEEFGNRVRETVRAHESVFKRMRYRTAGYSPVMIPEKFVIVGNGKKTLEVDLEEDVGET